jgi:hypothetical protein
LKHKLDPHGRNHLYVSSPLAGEEQDGGKLIRKIN